MSEEVLINVHRVTGPKEAIQFLKNSSHKFVEGLFYQAKRMGQVAFTIRVTTYILVRKRDGSFRIDFEDSSGSSPSLA